MIFMSFHYRTAGSGDTQLYWCLRIFVNQTPEGEGGGWLITWEAFLGFVVFEQMNLLWLKICSRWWMPVWFCSLFPPLVVQIPTHPLFSTDSAAGCSFGDWLLEMGQITMDFWCTWYLVYLGLSQSAIRAAGYTASCSFFGQNFTPLSMVPPSHWYFRHSRKKVGTWDPGSKLFFGPNQESWGKIRKVETNKESSSKRLGKLEVKKRKGPPLILVGKLGKLSQI